MMEKPSPPKSRIICESRHQQNPDGTWPRGHWWCINGPIVFACFIIFFLFLEMFAIIGTGSLDLSQQIGLLSLTVSFLAATIMFLITIIRERRKESG